MPGNDELQKLLDPSRYRPSQALTIRAHDDTFWPAGNHRFGDVSVGGEDVALRGRPVSRTAMYTAGEDAACVEPGRILVEPDELADELAGALIPPGAAPYLVSPTPAFGDVAVGRAEVALRGRPASWTAMYTAGEDAACVEPGRIIVEPDELADKLAGALIPPGAAPYVVSPTRGSSTIDFSSVLEEKTDEENTITFNAGYDDGPTFRWQKQSKHFAFGHAVTLGPEGNQNLNVSYQFPLKRDFFFTQSVAGKFGNTEMRDVITREKSIVPTESVTVGEKFAFEGKHWSGEANLSTAYVNAMAVGSEKIPIAGVTSTSVDIGSTYKYGPWSLTGEVSAGKYFARTLKNAYELRFNVEAAWMFRRGKPLKVQPYLNLGGTSSGGMVNPGGPDSVRYSEWKLNVGGGVRVILPWKSQ
jgi:hypothetical protein